MSNRKAVQYPSECIRFNGPDDFYVWRNVMMVLAVFLYSSPQLKPIHFHLSVSMEIRGSMCIALHVKSSQQYHGRECNINCQSDLSLINLITDFHQTHTRTHTRTHQSLTLRSDSDLPSVFRWFPCDDWGYDWKYS